MHVYRASDLRDIEEAVVAFSGFLENNKLSFRRVVAETSRDNVSGFLKTTS